MIDLHAHILPGVDDGVQNDAEAVAVTKQASEYGITSIMATPHIVPTTHGGERDVIKEQVACLQGILQKHNVSVQVLPGAEYCLDPKLPERLVNGELLTLNDSGRYLLVELPLHHWSSGLEQVLFEIQLNGVTPVLAHPERNRTLTRNPEKMSQLVRSGILAQVTAGSIVGIFGKGIQSVSQLFIRQQWVHFLGSDLHGFGKRLAAIPGAVRILTSLLGERQVNRILIDNPHLVLEGREIKGYRLG